jgi:hypothetical protein
MDSKNCADGYLVIKVLPPHQAIYQQNILHLPTIAQHYKSCKTNLQWSLAPTEKQQNIISETNRTIVKDLHNPK